MKIDEKRLMIDMESAAKKAVRAAERETVAKFLAEWFEKNQGSGLNGHELFRMLTNDFPTIQKVFQEMSAWKAAKFIATCAGTHSPNHRGANTEE